MTRDALRLASLGLAVFPTAANDPKRPVTRHGVKDATIDPVEIECLWRDHPAANVAVATGRGSGAFALDVDVRPPVSGLATLAALESEHGALPQGWATATPSGGRHLWFQHPPGLTLRNRVAFLPGLDVRVDGASVAVPPSRRGDGRAYAWARAPWDFAPVPAPDWLLTLIDPPPTLPPASAPIRFQSLDRLARYAASAINAECRDVAATGAGGRNARLFQAAARIGELVGAGLIPFDLAEAELEAAADQCGLLREDGRRAVSATIKSGLTHGIGNPRDVRR